MNLPKKMKSSLSVTHFQLRLAQQMFVFVLRRTSSFSAISLLLVAATFTAALLDLKVRASCLTVLLYMDHGLALHFQR